MDDHGNWLGFGVPRWEAMDSMDCGMSWALYNVAGLCALCLFDLDVKFNGVIQHWLGNITSVSLLSSISESTSTSLLTGFSYEQAVRDNRTKINALSSVNRYGESSLGLLAPIL